VRQLGFQESPHADMMRLVTKYSATVTDKSRIRYELDDSDMEGLKLFFRMAHKNGLIERNPKLNFYK